MRSSCRTGLRGTPGAATALKWFCGGLRGVGHCDTDVLRCCDPSAYSEKGFGMGVGGGHTLTPALPFPTARSPRRTSASTPWPRTCPRG